MPAVSIENESTSSWAKTGAWSGLCAILLYGAIASQKLPPAGLVLVGAGLGPLLGVAGLGLSRTLQRQRPSVAASLGSAFTFAAGALLTAMLLVQLAVKARASAQGAPPEFVGLWLGLDVAWDIYIGLGAGLFSLAMLRRPGFGRLFGIPGLLLSVALLALNLGTFPTPPGDAGLFDIGPPVGLWFLAVFVRLAFLARPEAEPEERP
ncbi:hypothetical protein LLH00_18765 [bacterium]|nr:hypothetical protein [bacterium]